jgi:hypothetical protein
MPTASGSAKKEQPSPEEKQALGRLILQYLAKKNSKKRRPVVEFLFQEVARMGDNPEPIKAWHILAFLKQKVTDKSEQAMRTLTSRLNAGCTRLFTEWEEGRQQKWCVYFDNGDYLPKFRLNAPPPKETDFFTALWQAHRNSLQPTKILYPEPQFFIDGQNTFLRNPEANELHRTERFQYLYPEKTLPLQPAYSYVPSGLVSAMLHIITCFQRWGQEIIPQPLHPHDVVPNTSDNLIVIGTPTSTRVIGLLEAVLPIHTQSKQITIKGAESVEDDPDDAQPVSNKWGTLSRRRQNDRVVTVLSARHGRTVDAMAKFITTPSRIPSLADKLGKPVTCPECFQGLFRVTMVCSQGNLQADETAVISALIV